MTDPRNPLITGVTNDPGVRSLDTLPTSYAVNQLFSGEQLANAKDLDDVMNCGTYRFNTTCTHLPTHMQGVTSGILTVMHDRYTIPVSNSDFPTIPATPFLATVVRQIAWPDGPTDVTPFTRTKYEGVWGEWQTMGGGLRRVRMSGNIASTAVQTNVMYYSFGSFTLNLPDPSVEGYSLGTKVGLEQYAGVGSVTAPNPSNANDAFSIATSPTYEMDSNGDPMTSSVIGPTVYIFEVVEGSTIGSKQWMLDVDGDVAARLNGLDGKISDEESARKAADTALDSRITTEIATEAMARDDADTTEKNARLAGDSALSARLGTDVKSTNTATSQFKAANDRIDSTIELLNNKQKLEKIYIAAGWTDTSIFKDGNDTDRTIADLLNYVTPIITVTAASKSCYLPSASGYPVGTKVTIEFTASGNITVTAGSDTETFANDTGSVLVLPFEVTYGSNGAFTWSLLVAG